MIFLTSGALNAATYIQDATASDVIISLLSRATLCAINMDHVQKVKTTPSSPSEDICSLTNE